MAKSRKKTVPPVGRCRALFQKIWLPLYERWRSVADLRFNVILLFFGILLACILPAGRDVIATISDSWAGESSGTGQWWLFVLATAFLGLQAWLWSRLLIQLRHRERPDWRDDWLLVQLPRLLGVVPYFAAAIALWRVPEGVHTGWQAGFMLLLGMLAYAFYWVRYRIFAKLFSWKAARALFQDSAGWFGLTRFEIWALLFSLALSALIVLWLSFDAVTLPMAIGSAALAFLAFALVIPPINLLIALVWRERFPILTALLLLAFGASFLNDNHRVRTLDDVPLPTRPTLEQAYVRWVAQAPRDRENPAQVTAVLVSAAGGASRAGLWTLATLQQLDEADPDFNRRIFAISAVSGGALGAIDYVAAIADDREGDRGRRHALALDHAGADFLAPAFGGMLYTDLVQRFLPLPLFNDRAWSIERGFEAAWADACEDRQRGAPCAELMRGPFLGLWNGSRAAWRPNLLLIGAIEEDGSRIATSNIDLVEQFQGTLRPTLPTVYDYHRISGLDVAASTAITNSARFPWISPAGRIADRQGRDRAHILDGGYFETSAAETSEDLAAALSLIQQRLCRAGTTEQCPALRIVFLTLLNGEVTERLPPAGSGAAPPPATVEVGRSIPREALSPDWRGRMAANDAFGPLYGFFAVQNSRAERTLTRLRRLESSGMAVPWVEVELVPCRVDGERPMAMSWVLSELTRKRMQRQLAGLRLQPIPAPQPPGCRTRLQGDFSRLARALRIAMPGAAPPAPPPRP